MQCNAKNFSEIECDGLFLSDLSQFEAAPDVEDYEVPEESEDEADQDLSKCHQCIVCKDNFTSFAGVYTHCRLWISYDSTTRLEIPRNNSPSDLVSSCFQIERSWVQILAGYSGWPSHYNNVGCSARLKTSFELNPVTEGKQGTFPFLSESIFYFTSCHL